MQQEAFSVVQCCMLAWCLLLACLMLVAFIKEEFNGGLLSAQRLLEVMEKNSQISPCKRYVKSFKAGALSQTRWEDVGPLWERTKADMASYWLPFRWLLWSTCAVCFRISSNSFSLPALKATDVHRLRTHPTPRALSLSCLLLLMSADLFGDVCKLIYPYLPM